MKYIFIGHGAFLRLCEASLSPTNAEFVSCKNHRSKYLYNLLSNISPSENISFYISEFTEDRGGSKELRSDGFTTAYAFIKYFIARNSNIKSCKFFLFSFFTGLKMPEGIRRSKKSNTYLCPLPAESQNFVAYSVENTSNFEKVDTIKIAAELLSVFKHEINYILPYKKSMINKNMSMKNVVETNKNIKVLIPILDDEQEQCERIKTEMDRFFDSDDLFEAGFPSFTKPEELIMFLKGENGEEYTSIQALLLDWYMFETDNNTKVEELVKKIRKIRPNIFIYILTKNEAYHEVIETLSEFERIQYHLKGENYDRLWETIMRDLRKRCETPFWTAYSKYAKEANFSWHTPGHSGGNSFKNSPYLNRFYSFFGQNVFKSDLSVSVDELGSLFSGSGKVEEAQEYVSKVFGTKKTFFVTNGSSTSNKILLQYLLKTNDEVIVDRNCHKSVHYGLILGNYKTHYLNSEYSETTGFFAPPSKQVIFEAVRENPNAKLLVLTGCTYDGIMMDLQDIIKQVKDINTNIKVMIDEAWFCYASFHFAYNRFSALKSGADYITHSAHKVLSAFSQASYIHVNDLDFDKDGEQFFMEAFCMNTSTSPQYNLIASLEIAAMQLEMEGFGLIDKIRREALDLKERFNRISEKIKIVSDEDLLNHFKTIVNDKCLTDPLKIVIDFTSSELEMDDVLKRFRDSHIQVEKSTKQGFILLLYTLGSSFSKTGALYKLLLDLDKEVTPKSVSDYTVSSIDSDILAISYPKKGFHHYFYNTDKEYLLLADVQKHINKKSRVFNCHLIVPYPPGIPILIPGTEITSDKCDYLLNLYNSGGEIHGIRDGKIAVYINNK